MKKIYLASTSPRRKILLQQLIGNNFEIIKSDYEEDNTLEMLPHKLAEHHALNKGKNLINPPSTGIVISADTFVVYDNKVLGKPSNTRIAINFLKQISGKKVEVISGFYLTDLETKKEIFGHEISKLIIGNLTDKLINDYVGTGEPMDKAGAFGIQEKGAIIVEKIDGCYFNIAGFPLYRINKALEQLGVNIFDYK